ncbi:trypsin-like peptidase domain-containing protein, partial [Streptomyces sp. NPDC051133]|uniref:S1C family serine protease n=1 Tax=Streptomyces sp. NPDC051133 TaxID=3155521 RepID=UPI00341FF4B4
ALPMPIEPARPHRGDPASSPSTSSTARMTVSAARALPSVVTIHVTGSDEEGTGTGFVLDTDGHILTNNHVVAPAASGGSITVSFSTGDSVKAKVVGRDSGYDLAVVQVHGVHGLTPLPLGNSDTVKVGDPVVAIGAPFDLANTVTSGIISAKERPITAGGEKGDGSDVSYVDALQTDAPINPGNSGGPLLDSRAQVIGINSAIRSADSGSDSEGGQAGSIGLGFAIPVNQAKRVAEELINEGHATHPVIGVILDMGYTGDGARVDDKGASGGPAVLKGGPGARAGLKPGDVITEVDGQRVHTGEELIVKIRAHRPGDRLRLTVERGGTERDVSLVLGASEQN